MNGGGSSVLVVFDYQVDKLFDSQICPSSAATRLIHLLVGKSHPQQISLNLVGLLKAERDEDRRIRLRRLKHDILLPQPRTIFFHHLV